MIDANGVCGSCGRNYSDAIAQGDPDVGLGKVCPEGDCPSRDRDFVDWNLFMVGDSPEDLDDWIEALMPPGLEIEPPAHILTMAREHAARLQYPVMLDGYRVNVDEAGGHVTDTHKGRVWAGYVKADGTLVPERHLQEA